MTAIEVFGWAGNALFFSRFLVQWIVSERVGRSVAPASFWWLSLAGAASMGVYTSARGEVVLLIGVSANALIYVRNLWIASGRAGSRALKPSTLATVAFLGVVLLLLVEASRIRENAASAPLWFGCVVLGQAFWSTRFVFQWWYSERRSHSHLPRAFWSCSLCGNLLLMAYALHLGDPVFVAGFALGPVVQVRNLILLARSSPAGDGGLPLVEPEVPPGTPVGVQPSPSSGSSPC